MSLGPAIMKQHSQEEWDAERPIIEYLYLQQHLPLSSVMRIVETNHCFRASIAMYKRKLRDWNIRKNRIPKPRSSSSSSSSTSTPPTAKSVHFRKSSSPRSIQQPDLNETIHRILDLFHPYLNHCTLLSLSILSASEDTQKRIHCPPRAVHIYSSFAKSIAGATAAFETGDANSGGEQLREGFLELENLIGRSGRTVFSLQSLFFGVVELLRSGFGRVARMVVRHVFELVFASERGGKGESANAEEVFHEENTKHPFPQMVKRLQSLAVLLEGDDTMLMRVFFILWSVYHRAASAATVQSIYPEISKRGYWNEIIWADRYPDSDEMDMGKNFEDMRPVVRSLEGLRDFADGDGEFEEEFGLVALDDLISVYSATGHAGFEESALEMRERIESRIGGSGKEGLAIREQGCVIDMELAGYYKEKGNVEGVVRQFGRLIPAEEGVEWEGLLREELGDWMRETGFGNRENYLQI